MTVTWAYWDKNGVCDVFRKKKRGGGGMVTKMISSK
jgi:hypothetical protein